MAFLPVLLPEDIQHAAMLITESFAGQASPEEQRRYQWEIFEVQKRFEAWGLVAPFLDHPDPNVQFFGAHTAQLKIVRDWDSFPKENAVALKDMLVELTGKSIAAGRSKVILRKLYVALCQIALKLQPTRPSQWPDWILATVTSLSGHGATPEQLLDFLAIVPEEVRTSDLISATKMSMNQSLLDAVPLVLQAISGPASNQLAPINEVRSALTCLEKWITWGLPASDLTPLIPMLISLLSYERTFIPASDVLQEVLTVSSLSDGSGTKVLTEPLLEFMSTNGRAIYEQSISCSFIDETSHSLCKLLCALGDHSTMYFAATLPSPQTQIFLRLMLGYTGLPGWFGADEEESELCLAFWYLLQEALWSVDFISDREPGKGSEGWERTEEKQWEVANDMYEELVEVLRRKVTWPRKEEMGQWTKDQVDKFAQYRRDVGDTLVNAYYILHDKMLENLVSNVTKALSSGQPHERGWEDVEASLHCILCTQEAVPVDDNAPLRSLFGSDILGKLPSSGSDLIRRTMLQLIGAYASWFTTQDSRLLMGVVSFVVAALSEPSLCLPAANALKEICDGNRAALAPHIGAFGTLHAGLASISETEKSKVLQSIASVIQAIPPQEAILPVEAIVSPVVTKLAEAITSAGQLPEEARNLCIQQLHALTGCARGLTSASEPLFALEESNNAELERMNAARQDPRMVKIRTDIVTGLEHAMQLWSTDAETADALSDLFKAITCLPNDTTLISLPPGPLLELTCRAAQRHLSGVWLTLSAMLLGQLDPPSLTTLSLGPKPETENLVLAVLPVLLEPCLHMLSSTQAIENNPDIAQAFFSFMETVTHHFTRALYHLSEPIFNTVIQTAVGALAVQERYALVAACTFLVSLIRFTLADGLADQADMLMRLHGKTIVHALLSGFAGISPRSALPNLIDLLAIIALKRPDESRVWMRETLLSDYFISCQASVDAKEKFLKTVASARSTKRIREASNQFALLARGLDGSSFGYATVSM